MEEHKVTVSQQWLKSINRFKGFDEGTDRAVPCAVPPNHRLAGKPNLKIKTFVIQRYSLLRLKQEESA